MTKPSGHWFNVYIDKQTGARLARLARARRTSRNALIREALARLLQQGAKAGWPPEVLDFQGVPGARSFERGRRWLGGAAQRPARLDTSSTLAS